MKIFSLNFICLLISIVAHAQFPWERPLKMAWSNDGISFDPPALFQDSSGVPSVIKWKGDTLICAFQWFRLPQNSPTWDKVAVKFSYDKGLNWTAPQPIIVNGLLPNYQRPFDPTLALLGSDSLRIIFSSSDGLPMGLDSTVNTYSAKSNDGIHYEFEPAARVDELNNRVIDPALIYFNNAWHYTAPIGSPQQGAYHYISPDGINFSKVPDIPSDNLHNWTGNLMISHDTLLRFYGSSPNNVWYKSSSNGGVWDAYVATNIQGGDPSVVQTVPNQFLMIYVGDPYAPNTLSAVQDENEFICYPNPVNGQLWVEADGGAKVSLTDCRGVTLSTQLISCHHTLIETSALPPAEYFVIIENKGKQNVCRIRKD